MITENEIQGAISHLEGARREYQNASWAPSCGMFKVICGYSLSIALAVVAVATTIYSLETINPWSLKSALLMVAWRLYMCGMGLVIATRIYGQIVSQLVTFPLLRRAHRLIVRPVEQKYIDSYNAWVRRLGLRFLLFNPNFQGDDDDDDLTNVRSFPTDCIATRVRRTASMVMFPDDVGSIEKMARLEEIVMSEYVIKGL